MSYNLGLMVVTCYMVRAGGSMCTNSSQDLQNNSRSLECCTQNHGVLQQLDEIIADPNVRNKAPESCKAEALIHIESTCPRLVSHKEYVMDGLTLS
jgi:hypothetical protein